MKKVLMIAFLLIAFLFSFLSCLGAVPRHFAMISTASFAIPCDFRSDMKGVAYEILEEDDYGRVLFSLPINCFFSDVEETAIVIMQKYDNQYVYFYEDINYLTGEMSEQEISDLKQKNDWNLPMDESKMSRRKVKYSFDNYLITDSKTDYSKIKKQWVKDFGLSNDSLIDSAISDFDDVRYELYFLAFHNQLNEKEYYFAIVDVASYETKYLKVEDITDYQNELTAFKRSCGWQYGY